MRQLLVESIVLSLVGGTGGVLLAAGATRALSVYAADRLPRADQISLDATVLWFAVFVSVAAGLLSACCQLCAQPSERRQVGSKKQPLGAESTSALFAACSSSSSVVLL